MLTLTDLFAGAGGSSTGAVSVPGIEVRLAANHWERAVEVHNANHPNAAHLCADISAYNPRRVPRTDLLWASPECTNHSVAKGVKRACAQPDLFGETLPDEAAERSRATMWDVPRFTEAHGYEAIIVENVVDVVAWVPFNAWLASMHAFGYEHQIISLNSMHAQGLGLPAPQSRDRVYIVFWKRGNKKPDVERMMRPQAWCPRCETVVSSRQAWKNGRTVGRYRQQYIYVCPQCGKPVEPGWLPASAAIDWSIPGTRIGDRSKPLADKTRKRIAAGIARYWRPFHIESAGNTYDAADPHHRSFGDPNAYYRAWPTEEPLKVLHTIESKALCVPVEGRDGKNASPLSDAMRTQTTRLETALAYMPFIAELRGGSSDARSVADALATITAGGNHHGLVSPYYGASESASSTDNPIGALTTVDRYGLVTPAEMESAEAQVDDCMFRMLEPHEVAAGMAFPGDYIWRGTRRERVRMAGNAVTPPAARDLLHAVAESLS